jgi:hypothetical protein
MTAGPRQNQGSGTRTLIASLPTPSGNSVGICQTGPVWTPDPWGRNKPDLT